MPHVDPHAHLANRTVNFLDENHRIGIPIFMIHGNHDDPTGLHRLAVADLLSSVNLVNYFGRQPEVDNINIGPLVIQKGRTRLALYGLGNIRDERLNRAFERGKVNFIEPPGTEKEKKEHFKLMLIHQNRPRGDRQPSGLPDKNHISDHRLPDWLDLVVWGHEHECKIDPVESDKGHFHNMQPGSSVVTSYVSAEAVAKHISYLEIHGTQYKTVKVPLKTVRPFKIDEIVLTDNAGIFKHKDQLFWDDLTAQEVDACCAWC